MKIQFKSKQLDNLCNSLAKLKRKYSEKIAKLIMRRLQELNNAKKLSAMRELPGRCEELIGNREGELSIRTGEQFRIIFEPMNDPIPQKEDGGLDWEQVTIIRILEISKHYE